MIKNISNTCDGRNYVLSYYYQNSDMIISHNTLRFTSIRYSNIYGFAVPTYLFVHRVNYTKYYTKMVIKSNNP